MLFGILIYPGVEPIDLATFGVLSMARRIEPSIKICTIGPRRGPVAFSNGLKVEADYGLDDAPLLDVLMVTGGPGWVTQAANPEMLGFLRRCTARNMVSVCTGAMILAASGRLDGCIATTKREVALPERPPIDVLRATYPAIDVRDASLVDQGAIITGGGVSLCIDTTLYVLERLFGAGMAAETARILEYARAREANRTGFPPIVGQAAAT